MKNMKQIAFTADPALVRVMIESQAGTIAKAIMEGVMNSVDAKASRIDIVTGPTEVSVEDNGVGFTTAEEITENFGVMGRPHAMDDDGMSTDARYGRFRIGRGQMFNFGVNDWYTNQFHLHVDFRASKKSGAVGFGFEETDRELHRGCKAVIKLYEPLNTGWLRVTRTELKHALKHVDVAVYLDGELISSDPAQVKWDIVTADAYISRKKDESGVDIYNEGVFVETVGHWQMGCSGVVVSRKQLKLNSARNQVLRSSPAWRRIENTLKGVVIEKSTKEVIKTVSDARRTCELFAEGDIDLRAFSKLRCLPDVSGFFWSMDAIRQQASPEAKRRKFVLDGAGRVSVAFDSAGSQRGDRAMQTNRALVLDSRVLEWLPKNNGLLEMRQIKVVTMEHLESQMGACQYEIVDVRMLKANERLMLSAIDNMAWYANNRLQSFSKCGAGRSIVLGRSNSAIGWTDAESYVAIDLEWLRSRLNGRPQDFTDIVSLVVHEFAHDTASDTDHVHNPQFYTKFHDDMIHHGGFLVSALERAWVSNLNKLGTSKALIRKIEENAKWRAAQLTAAQEAEAAHV